MGFILQYTSEGIACAGIQCDGCAGIITDTEDASVVWKDSGARPQIHLLCKQCDPLYTSQEECLVVGTEGELHIHYQKSPQLEVSGNGIVGREYYDWLGEEGPGKWSATCRSPTI
jgi:hypothetical protein